MNTAKRLDVRTPLEGVTHIAKVSGVPMALATHHGTPTQSKRALPPDQALSSVPMALAKRL